ncbi:MAG: CARDB domain-containing protein [Candidatus Bathyarchaeia archaeon]
MPLNLAATKLKTIFILVLLLLIVLTVIYFHLETVKVESIKPAEFVITNLTVYPKEVEIDEPVSVGVNITNIGDEAGNYSITLLLDNQIFENRTIMLSGGESKTLEFTIKCSIEGNHTVSIGNFTEWFYVKAPTLPETMEIINLLVRPYEVWPGETVSITSKIVNKGTTHLNFTLYLEVNGTRVEGKKLYLKPGEEITLEFSYTPEVEGTYRVKLGNARGMFTVVPRGMHTLCVSSMPLGVEFTINGKIAKTPYAELLPVGVYTITAPKEHIPSRFEPTWQFRSWEDGSTTTTRTINLQEYTSIIAMYVIMRCCPALYVWNGTTYVYVTEVSDGTGYLGILDHFKEDGSMAFAYSYPWDYIKLRVEPKPKNGFYDFIFIQNADEIFYIDSVTLIIVDHPEDVEVYSTKATYIYNLEEQGVIYTVSKTPKAPVSATYISPNGEILDALPLISKLDGIYTPGHEFQWDTLELNLGDLSEAKQIKLIVSGTIFYSPGEIQGEWAAKFINKPGERPFPPPYMEVMDENGNWIPVPEGRQFPLCDVGTDIFVVNLTGLFPTNNYVLRIYTFFDTRFDFIGVDTTPQQEIEIMKVKPVKAYLMQAFPTNSTSSGNFTKYGEVTELVLEADDMFVIGRQGDMLQVLFPIDLPPVPVGMKRSYFIFVSCWFKVKGLPYLSFTVDPLPFHGMSSFPYPPTESYPYDEAHLEYLRTYNTRSIP